MDGNMSQGGMYPSGAYAGFDLQRSMQIHNQAQQPQVLHHHNHPHSRQGSAVQNEGFPFAMGAAKTCDQTMPIVDFNKGERCKNSGSDEDEPSFNEDGVDNPHDFNKGKKALPWQRVKWTDKMVRLLITAVSYIGEDASSDCSGGGRRKYAVLQKKGKWKSISKVMAERGYHVSPQQCEDKFNDLNKRYKKLNDMLGRGTSCRVVENPDLLDFIDFLSEKEKDDVRKILNSKHLFYEEMCSYHNGNRLHLPHDPVLQHSLQLALRSRDENDSNDMRRNHHDDFDEDDQHGENYHDDYEENHGCHVENRRIYGVAEGCAKRMKQGEIHEDVSNMSALSTPECNKSLHMFPSDRDHVISDCTRSAWLQRQWVESHGLQLEEQRLQIRLEMLELEKERLKWESISRKKDHELERMRAENEKMKLENEQMALELKRKELAMDYNNIANCDRQQL